MRVFNRLVVALIFAAIAVAGAFTAIYWWGLFGYSLSDLPLHGRVGQTGFYSGLRSFVSSVQGGSMTVAEVAVMVIVALAGVALLLAELKPPAPRYAKVGDGIYVTRDALEDEALRTALEDGRVLYASARAKPRRGGGARVRLRAAARAGENLQAAGREVRARVLERLAERGLDNIKLKIKFRESSGRGMERRVR